MPVFLLLALAVASNAHAGEVWRWTDEAGGTHLGNTPPEGAAATLVYSRAEGRIFRWQDAQGAAHFGDVPPVAKPEADLREIVIEPPGVVADPERYSIERQAERLAESNRQLEQARLEKRYARLEQRRIARELELIRMEEQIRTRGYGPRPWMYPYARRYDAYY